MGLLSETQIRAAKPGSKEYLLNDGDNLYLRVRATGKVWVYRYTKGGKAVKLGRGPYPEVTLAQARAKVYEANSQRTNGLDPKQVRDRQAAAICPHKHTSQTPQQQATHKHRRYGLCPIILEMVYFA